MPELPGFEELWSRFASGQTGEVMKNNPMMEELCRIIFAMGVTEVSKAMAGVPRDLLSVFMLKLAASSAEAGIRSVDRLQALMNKKGDGDVSVDLQGVFVPRGFRV